MKWLSEGLAPSSCSVKRTLGFVHSEVLRGRRNVLWDSEEDTREKYWRGSWK